MPAVGSWVLAVVLVSWGPPKLPPLPGEQPPAPAEPSPGSPAQPTPTAPPPRKPAPIEPARPAPTPPPPVGVPPGAKATPPPGPAAPLLVPSPRPEIVEPPPPEAPGPAPEPAPGPRPTAKGSTGDEPPAPRTGTGVAPAMGASLLPGDDPPPPMPRFPAPRRPPYSGTGMFIGAAVTFSAALAEQIVSHVLVKRRCIEPFAARDQADPMDADAGQSEAEDFGDALLECAPGVLPAVALRVHSDLGLLATIGLASAGAAYRAQRRAYDDVFADRPERALLGLRAGGITLIGAGVVTWLTTGALSWGLLATCRDARCATRARLVAFTTRDTGAVLIAAGAGMLTYAMTHRRAYDRFLRDRALSVGTAWLPGGAGLSLSGRF